MKCLIFSDAHGYTGYVRQALKIHPDAETVFFLGDGLREIDALSMEFPDKFWISVRGNCDFYSYFRGAIAEKTETVSLAGYRITATHGDLFGAKYGIGGLVGLARETNSDAVLFGHTHSPFTKYVSEYEKPFYLFNPGSISQSSGSYGVLTLTDALFFSHGELI